MVGALFFADVAGGEESSALPCCRARGAAQFSARCPQSQPSPACSVRSSSRDRAALIAAAPRAVARAFLAPELEKPRFAVRPEERAPPSSELPLRTVLCYCERPAALLDGRSRAWVRPAGRGRLLARASSAVRTSELLYRIVERSTTLTSLHPIRGHLAVALEVEPLQDLADAEAVAVVRADHVAHVDVLDAVAADGREAGDGVDGER